MKLLRRTRVVPDDIPMAEVKDIVAAIAKSHERAEPKPVVDVRPTAPLPTGSPDVYWDTVNRLYRKDEWRYAYDDDDPNDCITINDVSIVPRKAGPQEPEVTIHTVEHELDRLVTKSMNRCKCASPVNQCEHCARVDNIMAIHQKLLPAQLEEEYKSLQQLERMVRFNKNVDQQFELAEKARAAGQEYEDRMRRMHPQTVDMYEDVKWSAVRGGWFQPKL